MNASRLPHGARPSPLIEQSPRRCGKERQGPTTSGPSSGRGSKRLRPYIVQNGILLIPVKGVLLHDFPYQLFDYATGYEYIGKAFERGLGDDRTSRASP
jgi:hypothetical protein